MSDTTDNTENTEAPSVEDVTGKGNTAEPKVRKPRARKSSKPTALEAIVKVMHANGPTKTMKVPAIIAAAVPLTDLKGKYPGQTIYSVIYSNAKKADALVQQVGKGEFKLTAKGKTAATATGSTAPAAPKRSRAKKTEVAAAA